MPSIRVALFKNTRIIFVQREFAKLTIDVFGGHAVVLNELGIHEPIDHPLDTFSMEYDHRDETIRDEHIVRSWMDDDKPILVEIFSPYRVVFSTADHPETVEFEQTVQNII